TGAEGEGPRPLRRFPSDADRHSFLARAANTNSPAGDAGEVRRVRGCLLRNQRGRLPAPNGLPFGTRVGGVFVSRTILWLWLHPLRGFAWTLSREGEQRLRHHRWRVAHYWLVRASWTSGHLALLPGAGRLHVGCRMAPSTSRRCKRRRYCIRQPWGP